MIWKIWIWLMPWSLEFKLGIVKFFKKKRNWFNYFVNTILFEFVLLAISLFIPAYYYIRCNVPSFLHPFGVCSIVSRGSNFVKGFDYSVFLLIYLLIFTLIIFGIYLFRKNFDWRKYLKGYSFPKRKYWIWLGIISLLLFFWKIVFFVIIFILGFIFMFLIILFAEVIFVYWWSSITLGLIIFYWRDF